MTINNNFAQFEGYNNQSAKFWLKYMAALWMNATHGCEDIQDEYDQLVNSIDGLVADKDLKAVQEGFQRLQKALDKVSPAGNETCAVIEMEKYNLPEGDVLRLEWYGVWTPGRCVSVRYAPGYGQVVVARWDTATNSESSFLALPSSAEDFVQSGVDPDASIQGLKREE